MFAIDNERFIEFGVAILVAGDLLHSAFTVAIIVVICVFVSSLSRLQGAS